MGGGGENFFSWKEGGGKIKLEKHWLKGIAYLEIAKSHVFLLMQISYPYIFWNNIPKFQENRVSSFWDMRKSMCVIVVGEYHYRGGGRENHKNKTHTKIKFYIIFISFFFLWWILKVLQIVGGQGALSVQKN